MSDEAPGTEAYLAYAREHGLEVDLFAIDGLDRVGMPVWSASLWAPDGEPSAHGVGYGETPAEARRGALGEAVETHAAARWARHDAREAGLWIVDVAIPAGGLHPAALSLPAGTAVDAETRLGWVGARTWPGDEPRLVPLEAVVQDAKGWADATTGGVLDGLRPLFPPITNGLGAGPADEPDRAVRHGLLELLQRDLNWPQFKALDTGRVVDADAVAPELVARMRAAGLEPVLKYAGQALGVHAFHAAARDRDPSTPAIVRTATGEGADPDPAVAARKALLEQCSSRSRKRFFFGGEEALAIAPARYRERFAGAVAQGGGGGARERGIDLAGRFDALLGDETALGTVVERITAERERAPLPPAYAADEVVDLLVAAGLEVLVVDLTPPGAPARVVKVVVPGLEAEVLSHHRLGPRGVGRLRARLPHVWHEGATAPGEAWRSVPGGWVDVTALDALAEAFFPLYREPDRHTYVTP